MKQESPFYSRHKKHIINILLGCLCCILTTACFSWSTQSFVPSTAAPSQASGYIAGLFSGMKGQKIAFGIVENRTNKEYIMPFFDSYSERKEQLRLIEVPPGAYKITYWATYNLQNWSKPPFPKGQIIEFEVKPGRVVFIGRYTTLEGPAGYVATQRGYIPRTKCEIMPLRFFKEDIYAQFKTSYPNFPIDSIDFLH